MLLLTAAMPCIAAELRVLAAFTLKPALDAAAQQYRQGGGEVTLVYGPTPSLAQQIENDAPADLFFSADPMWMDELAGKNLLRAGSVTGLVGTRLVLIARKDSAANPVLGDTQLAMCDPDSHPLGRCAKASLTALGLWAKTQTKVVRAENRYWRSRWWRMATFPPRSCSPPTRKPMTACAGWRHCRKAPTRKSFTRSRSSPAARTLMRPAFSP
ncbi:MAG: molybdate ABC transporter substrate-binding protein [Alphaproteobacteria bacterium]|nr:molybdate ABC transporter substrate-binding protein [Alphaproteobacteria bacterium]